MPDRAVVESCNCFEGLVFEKRHGMSFRNYCPCEKGEARRDMEHPPKPRALCAISEDRQWLVVLSTVDTWKVLRRRFMGYEIEWSIEDTGQSAEDVLREFMEGRGG